MYSIAELLGSFEFWSATEAFALDVRDLFVTNPSGSGCLAQLVDGLGVPLAQLIIPVGAYNGHWTGRQVVNPGDVCTAEVSGAIASVRVTAYTLTTP
ncbi:MAG: hypothetical protein ACLP0J_05270 [Solirubrobacteraceae bacterium]